MRAAPRKFGRGESRKGGKRGRAAFHTPLTAEIPTPVMPRSLQTSRFRVDDHEIGEKRRERFLGEILLVSSGRLKYVRLCLGIVFGKFNK